MKCFMTNQDCNFEREIQDAKSKKSDKQLFLVSPFGYPYDELFEEVIEPSATAAGLIVNRADRAFQLGFVMCQRICKLIREAAYVMVDITEPNPNVYYELAVCRNGRFSQNGKDVTHKPQSSLFFDLGYF
jgi:hypothetical protein